MRISVACNEKESVRSVRSVRSVWETKKEAGQDEQASVQGDELTMLNVE